MRLWKKITLGLLTLLLVGAGLFLIPTLWFKPWSVHHFYARVFLVMALKHPMLLSQLRILEPMGIHFHSDDLDDFSVEFQASEAKWLERQLKILRSYDREAMTESDRLSTDVLTWFMADQHTGNRWLLHNYPVNQFFGVQTILPHFMTHTHQIQAPRDADNYIKRVSKFGTAINQILEGLEKREQQGIVPPRFVIRKALEQLNEFTSAPPEENVLCTHFEEAIQSLSALNAEKREEMAQLLRSELESTVYPAYEKLAEYLSHLASVATEEAGVWKLPDGEAFYAHQLRSFTTTDMTPDQVHQLGLAEVAKLEEEMRQILESEGVESDDLAGAIRGLSREERFLYPDSDEGREQILADYQAIIDEIDQRLDDLFDLRPTMGVEVKPVPELEEANIAGAYYQPAPLDGSKPGTFFVSLRDLNEIQTFRMRTLAYHEAIPGHHFQIDIAQHLQDLPFFRRIIPFTAFGEGWALYAETIAAENGFHPDPYDRLGYLMDQMLRAVRLVVDTGIHAKRWTREQAIEYMMTHTGMPEGEVVNEIERYIVIPGQACAYKVGQLKILELRERAREKLGERFDIREFHNVVLSNGALPLTLLEQVVKDWLAEQG